jgi:hypothetical protein
VLILPSISTGSQGYPALARNVPDTDADLQANFTGSWIHQ